MKRILLMGCGGTGSWLALFIAFGRRNSVFHADVTLADPDIVEPKNLLYSNFLPEDVGKNKAEVLAKRYYFRAVKKEIKRVEELESFDLVITATDNGYSRVMVHKSGKPWIDLRCKGRAYAAFAGKGETDEARISREDIKVKGDSCQYTADLISKNVQYGNIIAASIGWQMVMNWMRKEKINRVVGFV